jgi:TRAP-type mannitol/chloroaromatic compound transport system permease small subunit
MNALLAFSRSMDWLTERIGRSVYWLLLIAVVVSTINAIARKAFDVGSNAYLEAQWYMFAAMFMLGAGYVFLHDQHVRIDVIASRLKRKTQVWIDIVGIVVFLMPLCVFVSYTALPSIELAIRTNEVSANPGGLIRWPLYILVPLGFGLLFLQALSELIKRLAFVMDRAPDPHAKAEKTEEQKLAEDIAREAAERQARALAAAPEGAKA